MTTCRYCGQRPNNPVPTTGTLVACLECNYCCDCGDVQATDWERDPLCASCLAAREERDQADMETAAEDDVENRYYREGRYAR